MGYKSLIQVASARAVEGSTALFVRTRRNLLVWLGIVLVVYACLNYWGDLPFRSQPEPVQEDRQDRSMRVKHKDSTSPDASALVELVAVAKTGDTLDGLLKRTELPAEVRAAAIRALSSEFNPKELRPGHEVVVRSDEQEGEPKELVLTIDAGVKILVTLDDIASIQRIEPDLIAQEHATTFELNSSLYASLKNADAPTRFATDLSLMLNPLVPFNRAFKGGEVFNILWHEYLLPDEREAKPPAIKYVRIQMPERVIELVRSSDSDNHARIYENGELVRTLVIPVEEGQISSAFGPREHPVFGNVRQHTGVDYAAQRGAPVSAVAAGEVIFMGRRRGYGRVIDIEYSAGVVGRYAHLEDFQPNLTTGSIVSTGEIIGSVGSTGTTTGPNLHYEILRNGRPMDPLFGSRTVLSSLTPPIGPEQSDLQGMRYTFSQTLMD